MLLSIIKIILTFLNHLLHLSGPTASVNKMTNIQHSS